MNTDYIHITLHRPRDPRIKACKTCKVCIHAYMKDNRWSCLQYPEEPTRSTRARAINCRQFEHIADTLNPVSITLP